RCASPDPTTSPRAGSSFRFLPRSGAPPFGLAIHRFDGELSQGADGAAVHRDRGRRHARPGWFFHERHEFVGKAGHGAADANPADIGTAADSIHPTAFGHVALDDRSPASELDDARFLAIRARKIGLFVIATAIAALVYGLRKEPFG